MQMKSKIRSHQEDKISVKVNGQNYFSEKVNRFCYLGVTVTG